MNSIAKEHIMKNFPWQLDAFENFEHYKTQNKFPSGLIIYGQKEVGKTEFVKLMVKSLLCKNDEFACMKCSDCQLVEISLHPNMIKVGLEEGSKQIKLHSTSTKDEFIQIDDLIKLLAYSETKNKIAIINPADTINKFAANALLKTLEELGKNKYIIFVANHIHKLPPTIISRCQKINLRFSLTSNLNSNLESNIANWWLNQTKQQNLNAEQKKKAIKQFHNLLLLSHMSIFKALEFKEKINLVEDCWKYLSQLVSLEISAHQMAHLTYTWDKNFLVSVLLTLIENMMYQKALAEKDESFEDLIPSLDSLFQSNQDELSLWFDSLTNTLKTVSFKNLSSFYQDINKVNQMLNTPVNAQLMFENLFTIFQLLPRIKKYPNTFAWHQIRIHR